MWVGPPDHRLEIQYRHPRKKSPGGKTGRSGSVANIPGEPQRKQLRPYAKTGKGSAASSTTHTSDGPTEVAGGSVHTEASTREVHHNVGLTESETYQALRKADKSVHAEAALHASDEAFRASNEATAYVPDVMESPDTGGASSSSAHGKEGEDPAATGGEPAAEPVAAPAAHTVNLEEDPDVQELLEGIGSIFNEPTLFSNSGADVAIAAGNSNVTVTREEMDARLMNAASAEPSETTESTNLDMMD